MNRAFKVIEGHPYWCRQEFRTACCRNVQLMPTFFLKLTKIWQQQNSKFVHFNDTTQVWRRPSKKCLRISTNDLCCQKLELLTYIFVADSISAGVVLAWYQRVTDRRSDGRTVGRSDRIYHGYYSALRKLCWRALKIREASGGTASGRQPLDWIWFLK